MVSSWSTLMRSSCMAVKHLVAVVVRERLTAGDGLRAEERGVEILGLAEGIGQQAGHLRDLLLLKGAGGAGREALDGERRVAKARGCSG